MTRAIEQMIKNVVARGVVLLVDAATKLQTLQVRLTAHEVKGGLEHVEPYGYTSCPQAGAEAFAVFMQGDRSNGVVLCIADRRFRLQGLKPGEVALYSDEGDSFVFKRGNLVELTTKTFRVTADEIDLNAPKVTAQKNINAGGTVKADVDVIAGDLSVIGHRHKKVQPGDGESGGPVQ